MTRYDKILNELIKRTEVGTKDCTITMKCDGQKITIQPCISCGYTEYFLVYSFEQTGFNTLEEVASYIDNYEEHKKEISEYKKKYRKDNPEKFFNHFNNRRLKEENQGNGINREQWFEMMEFFNWGCAYSGIQLTKENRSIDHIVALDNGGEHEIWNLVPCYLNYNSSKREKNMLEWYLEQPFFSIERLTKIYEWRIYAYEKWGKEMA